MVALIRTRGISDDIPIRVDGHSGGVRKAWGKKRMQVDDAGRVAAPQHCTPTDPPHLLLAVSAKSYRRLQPAGGEVHHTIDATPPQQRVRSPDKSTGNCLDAISHLLAAGDA